MRDPWLLDVACGAIESISCEPIFLLHSCNVEIPSSAEVNVLVGTNWNLSHGMVPGSFCG